MALNPPLSTPHLGVTGGIFVITGGTQGLGMAIARLLKEQGAAGLVLVSRSQDKGKQACDELSSENCKCVWIQADLSQAKDASSVIPRAVEAMKDVGPISGIVNAAATSARGNLTTTTANDFDVQMAVNVRAPFLITQAAAKVMTKGSIVNITSVAAHGGAPFIMAYSVASKLFLYVLYNLLSRRNETNHMVHAPLSLSLSVPMGPLCVRLANGCTRERVLASLLFVSFGGCVISCTLCFAVVYVYHFFHRSSFGCPNQKQCRRIVSYTCQCH